MEFLFENDKCRFYENTMTKMLTERCSSTTLQDWPVLENYRVLIAEEKDGGSRIFVVANGNEIVYANTQSEAVAYWIDYTRYMEAWVLKR
jgi:hypothetical protein